MRIIPEWNQWFLDIAHIVSTRSKDPHTQVGCVIVNPYSRAIISSGYNGMPTGIVETNALWERPTKYDYVCHAEENAIALAARHGTSTDHCMAFITHFPCLSCFKLLVQSGITGIFTPQNSVTHGAKDDVDKIYKMLHELPNIIMEEI